MQMHYHWGKIAAKKWNVATLDSAHQGKKQCNFGSGWLERQQGGYYESCEPKTFVWCWNNVERKYIQEQQSNEFHFYSQNMGFVNRMDQNVVKYRIVIRMKKWWWFPFI